MLNRLDIANCIVYTAFNIYIVKENVNINEIKPYLISWVNGAISHVLIFIATPIISNYCSNFAKLSCEIILQETLLLCH